MGDAKILYSIQTDGSSRALARTEQASTLVRDIDERRRSLAHSIAELRHAVAAKLDVKKQAQHLVQVSKARAVDALGEARSRIRRHPGLYVGVGLGLVALGAATWVAVHRLRPPRWQRTLDQQLKTFKRALDEGIHIQVGYPDPR